MPYPKYQLFSAKGQLIIWVFEKVAVIILGLRKLLDKSTPVLKVKKFPLLGFSKGLTQNSSLGVLIYY